MVVTNFDAIANDLGEFLRFRGFKSHIVALVNIYYFECPMVI